MFACNCRYNSSSGNNWQYDWMNDPHLSSKTFEWDIVCDAGDWKHYHNYEHHTFTNIVGKDRDVGYMLLRVTEEQRWRLGHLFAYLPKQPGYNKRLRALAPTIAKVLAHLATSSPSFCDNLRLLDSTPVPCGQSVVTAS